MTWRAVVPLKPAAEAKTRLLLPPARRAALVEACAADLLATLSAVVADVIVVGRAPAGAPVTVLPDPGGGINDAVAAALRTLPGQAAVLVAVGDLPCVRPQDVASLLEAGSAALARGSGAFVGDQRGTGTTALLGFAGALQPRFGARSRAAHRAAGLVELTGPAFTRWRRDVDTLVDLADARRLGVGERVAALR